MLASKAIILVISFVSSNRYIIYDGTIYAIGLTTVVNMTGLTTFPFRFTRYTFQFYEAELHRHPDSGSVVLGSSRLSYRMYTAVPGGAIYEPVPRVRSLSHVLTDHSQ